MTVQEAIEAIRLEKIEIQGGARRLQQFLEGLAVATEALEKQAGIERTLERLEEAEAAVNGHKCEKDDCADCAGCADCKIENAYAEAIKIIKEEVG